MLGFESLQFAEQLVIFRIGYGRRIQHIVGMVVPFDLDAQLRDALRCRHQENNLAACALPGVMCPTSMRSSVAATWARICAIAPSFKATRWSSVMTSRTDFSSSRATATIP